MIKRSSIFFGLIFVMLEMGYSEASYGASYVVNGAQIVVSGMLGEEDPFKFATELKDHPRIREVVFDNCLGGTGRAGYRFSVIIKERRLGTVARNQCQSSCALAFMGGQTRRLSSEPGLNLLLFHGARNLYSNIDLAKIATEEMVSYVNVLSGNKLSKQIMELISKSSRIDQGVVIFSQDRRGLRERSTSYCDGMVNGNLYCEPLQNADPVTLGILTTNR